MYLFIPKNIKEVYELQEYYDGLILSLENLSINYPEFTLEEIKQIIKEIKNKKIFINLNKNMHNKDIPYLKEIMKELDNLEIEGILYYDLSVPNIGSKHNLVWSVCHMTTNYKTCEFWHKRGIKYTFLSNEITLEEIKEISENTKMELMVQVFGYTPIFASIRDIVKNYRKTFNLKDASKVNYIKYEEELYPIVNEKETVVYNSKILNAIDEIEEYKKMNIKYFIINSFLIDDIKEVLKNFKTNTKFNYQNQGKGFLYEETIYKVKKWENPNY